MQYIVYLLCTTKFWSKSHFATKKAEAFPRNFLPTKEDSIWALAKKFAKIDRQKIIKISKNNIRMGANTFKVRTYGLVGQTTKLCRRNLVSFVVVDTPIKKPS